jgi:hypothetical protein
MARRWTWFAAGAGEGCCCSYGDATAVGVEMGSRGEFESRGIALILGGKVFARSIVAVGDGDDDGGFIINQDNDVVKTKNREKMGMVTAISIKQGRTV